MPYLLYDDPEDIELYGQRYCCDECGDDYEYEESAADCCSGYRCSMCGDRYEYEEDAYSCCSEGGYYGADSDDGLFETTAVSDSSDSSDCLLIPALSDRPSRTVSCEQEIGQGGRLVARRLHSAGLTESPSIAGYHSHMYPDSFAYVEEDGTVDAEIIYQRMRLDNPATASRFEMGIRTVADAMRSGDARLDSRCGFHVHVGVGRDDSGNRCYSFEAIESLYHLTNYLEDTLYRLASANWSGHRSELQDNDYAMPSRKGLRGVHAVGSWAQSARGAVNFSPYLNSRRACYCGAWMFGVPQECECDYRGHCPTIEFRVFNATSNVRKVRAYIALSLALVAYAERHKITADDYPPSAWRGSHSEADGRGLRFILDKLPLTKSERADIVYCAERSSLRDVTPDPMSVYPYCATV